MFWATVSARPATSAGHLSAKARVMGVICRMSIKSAVALGQAFNTDSANLPLPQPTSRTAAFSGRASVNIGSISAIFPSMTASIAFR